MRRGEEKFTGDSKKRNREYVEMSGYGIDWECEMCDDVDLYY